MKFFIAFALIATVASAAYIKPSPVSAEMSEINQIVAAIQSPSTDPATAAALEVMLLESLGLAPISVGPAIVESNPISVGPAIVDYIPAPDGGAVTAVEPAVVNPSPINPSPVVIGEIPAGATPLVQIIVNVNDQQSTFAPSPVVAAPVEELIVPGPVNIVDGASAPEAVVSPIQVVEPVAPGPVNIVDGSPVVIEPVQVVEPVIVEPVQVGAPIIPSPVIALPDELN